MCLAQVYWHKRMVLKYLKYIFLDSFWRWQCKLFCIFWIVSHWIYWSFFKWQFRDNWKLKLKTRPPNNQIEKNVCVLEHWHTLYENAFSTQSFWFNFRAITNTIPTISQKKARAHTLKFIEIDPSGFYTSGTCVFLGATFFCCLGFGCLFVVWLSPRDIHVFAAAADARVYPILTFSINNNSVFRFFYSDMGIYIHNLIRFKKNTTAFVLFILIRKKKLWIHQIFLYWIRAFFSKAHIFLHWTLNQSRII